MLPKITKYIGNSIMQFIYRCLWNIKSSSRWNYPQLLKEIVVVETKTEKAAGKREKNSNIKSDLIFNKLLP